MQRDRFSRFQPTYPYMQHQIDLPPTISLSDGEEPPPYQGPCTLQLRDPEQQMELNRESVRAPPNRTIYDSDLIDIGSGLGGLGGGGGSMGGGGPRPPSSNSGISVANSSSHGRMEGPPPAYSEVMGHYPGSAFFLHQHRNNQRVGRPGGPGSRTIQQQGQSESTIAPAKAKDGQPEDLVWWKVCGGQVGQPILHWKLSFLFTPDQWALVCVLICCSLSLSCALSTLPCTKKYQIELQQNKRREKPVDLIWVSLLIQTACTAGTGCMHCMETFSLHFEKETPC